MREFSFSNLGSAGNELDILSTIKMWLKEFQRMNQLIHFKIAIVLLFKRFEVFPIQAFLDFQLYENKDSLYCVFTVVFILL